MGGNQEVSIQVGDQVDWGHTCRVLLIEFRNRKRHVKIRKPLRLFGRTYQCELSACQFASE